MPPVAGTNILHVVSAAINRHTTSGKLLGPEPTITPYVAFRAVSFYNPRHKLRWT